MDIQGLKKYGGDNIFLNSLNDLTRDAYTNSSNSRPLSGDSSKPVNRFEADIFLNSKESFETNNNRLNSLNEEILSLKQKLSIVPEKDKKIHELKCEVEKLRGEIEKNISISLELASSREENKTLRDKHDRLQLESMNNHKLKQECALLKKKIIELYNKNESKNNGKEVLTKPGDIYSQTDIEDIMAEDCEEEDSIDKIQINVIELKEILSNRLKSYHEKHIDGLIKNYNLQNKNSIDKEILEKLLFEAIHI